MGKLKRFRSAITGQFVSRRHAERRVDTTVAEDVGRNFTAEDMIAFAHHVASESAGTERGPSTDQVRGRLAMWLTAKARERIAARERPGGRRA